MGSKAKYILIMACFLVFLLLVINQYYMVTQNSNLYFAAMRRDTYTESELAWLAERQKLYFGDTVDAFPAQPNSKDAAQYQSYSIDLMNMLSIELETPAKLVPLNWADTFPALDSGAVDFISVTYSAERAQKYLLSEPMYKTRGIIFCSRTNAGKIDLFAELADKKIAAVKADYVIQALRQKAPDVQIIQYDKLSECMDALQSGAVVGVAGDEQNIMYYAQESALFGDYYILDHPVYVEDSVMAVRKSDPQLLSIMNKAIRSLKSNGTITKLQQKWFLVSVLIDDTEKRLQTLLIVTIIGVAAFAFLLVVLINKELKSIIRKRTAELFDSKTALETTLDAIPYELFVLGEQRNVIYVNQRVLSDFAMTLEELQQPENNPLKKQYCQPELAEMLERIFTDQRLLQQDIRLPNRILSVTCGQATSAEQVPQVIMIVEDVTKNRLNERQLLQSSKMAAIGQLAAGISHEIRNPLGLIRNYCYILKKDLLRDADKKMATLQAMEEAVDSANAMIENLLNFSRITPREMLLVNIREVLEPILALEKKRFKTQNIGVDFRCPPDVFMQGNPEGMKHIAINFISNAADAMPDGGMLQIRCYRHKSRIHLYFIDNGQGIEEVNLEFIFNPFFTSKPVGEGTGLGLYIAYQLIQEYQGKITVYSKQGKGTLFKIIFDRKNRKEMS